MIEQEYGFCQWCEQNVLGERLPSRSAQAFLLKSDDGKLHRIMLGKTTRRLDERRLFWDNKRKQEAEEYARQRAIDDAVVPIEEPSNGETR